MNRVSNKRNLIYAFIFSILFHGILISVLFWLEPSEKHSYVIVIFGTYQDEKNIFYQGGELFHKKSTFRSAQRFKPLKNSLASTVSTDAQKSFSDTPNSISEFTKSPAYLSHSDTLWMILREHPEYKDAMFWSRNIVGNRFSDSLATIQRNLGLTSLQQIVLTHDFENELRRNIQLYGQVENPTQPWKPGIMVSLDQLAKGILKLFR